MLLKHVFKPINYNRPCRENYSTLLVEFFFFHVRTTESRVEWEKKCKQKQPITTHFLLSNQIVIYKTHNDNITHLTCSHHTIINVRYSALHIETVCWCHSHVVWCLAHDIRTWLFTYYRYYLLSSIWIVWSKWNMKTEQEVFKWKQIALT